MLHHSDIPQAARARIRKGALIPAHQLALTADLQVDVERQRALTRYYSDAGVDGVAVGVFTTQFLIHENGMYQPVLELAAETVFAWTDDGRVLIAGVTGQTEQAVREATIARGAGYHAALLNVARLNGVAESEILDHCRKVADVMPVIGFSLLPECGGFHLSYDFWKAFARIENVIAIKMAPFNRYRTLDIIRAVVDSGRGDQVTLMTGNDDHIGLDLVVPFVVRSANGKQERRVYIKGGLLGHWGVWTKTAVDAMRVLKSVPEGADVPQDVLALDSIITDCNSAIYDSWNNLAGCNPGCLEILTRQGLLQGIRCLDPKEVLSPGQVEEINRVYAMYPEMNDDKFVADNLHRWLSRDGQNVPLVP